MSKEMEDMFIKHLVTATVGTQTQHDIIQTHMNEYFTRFPSYKDKFTQLEWYHIFLDFYDKINNENVKTYKQNSLHQNTTT